MPDVAVGVGAYTAPEVASSTTAQQILDQTWSILYTGVRTERDKTAEALDAGETDITTTYSAGGIQAGAKLSIDLEDYHVWSVTGTPTVATVQPGEFGSTAAAHASGAIIHVNVEWSPFKIFREINNELRALSSPSNGLYRVQVVTLTATAAKYGYDLTSVTNIDGIAAVWAETPGSSNDWTPVTDWRVERNQDTATFASGYALFTGGGHPGRDLRVAYRSQFSQLATLADNVQTTTGLPDSAHDILAMGAALRCAAPAEIDRNRTDAQGSGRRASEVPAGARLNAIRGLGQLRATRIREEAARLNRRWPVRLPRR